MQSLKVRQTERRRSGPYPVLVVAALLLLIPMGILPGVDLNRDWSYAQNPVPRVLPNTDVNPYGANFFLHLEAENWKIDKTLEMAAAAGLGWAKQQFPWESLEKSEGRYWDDRYNVSTWEKYDYIVDTAAGHGLQVIARLDRPPEWARAPGTSPNSPPRDYAAYGRFVGEVAKHFKGRVRYYQLWNEPNLTEEWGGQPVDPKAYVELLKVASAAIKANDPDAFVLSAPLAQTLERNERHLSDVVFLEEMYRAGAKDHFDILFANAYGFSLPPEDPPREDVLNFSRVLLQRQVMERHGDGAKAVWFNEFGWNASPVDLPPERLLWGRVSEQEQAEYTARGIEMARQQWPWAGVFNVWFFRQSGQQYQWDDSQFYFRMVDAGFTPRLVYKQLRAATNPLQRAGPGSYQETNPALVVEGGWTYARGAGAEGGSYLLSQRTGDSFVLDFFGGGVALLARFGPDCGRLYLSLDGNGVDGLPRDAGGHSYLDLYAEQTSWQLVTVAQDLGASPHRLQVTVAAELHAKAQGRLLAVDAFVVTPADPFPWTELALGGAAVVVVLGAVVWRRRSAGGGSDE
ncbi:MAG: glycoside hydrolase 5 family protein [Chloroflexota bacterium]